MSYNIEKENKDAVDSLLEGQLTDAELKEFMDSQVCYFLQFSSINKIGQSTSCEDFINSDVGIVSEGELSKEFFLDDDSIYEGLESRVVNIYNKIVQQRPEISLRQAYINASIQAVQMQIIKYFNNTIVGNRINRSLMLADIISDDNNKEKYSISELKDVAMCMERAVVSHNMLKVLGIDNTLEVGGLHINNGTHLEGHAWIVLDGTNGKNIFDPLNCHIHKDASGAVVKVSPLILKYDGLREPVSADQKIYDEDGLAVSATLTYIFASESDLNFASSFLGR